MEECDMETDSLFFEPTQRKRIPDEAKRQLVLEFRRSGMKMKDWCNIRGIGFSTFKRWLYKQRIGDRVPTRNPESNAPASPVSWSRVDIEPAIEQRTALGELSAIRIDVGTVSIHLPYETPVALLKAVLLEVMPK
jgi:transposase-like protein